jgi:hypothetical protein
MSEKKKQEAKVASLQMTPACMADDETGLGPKSGRTLKREAYEAVHG